MPNQDIYYSGNDRPYVQYYLPELKDMAHKAVTEGDLATLHDIADEVQKRPSRRANDFLLTLMTYIKIIS